MLLLLLLLSVLSETKLIQSVVRLVAFNGGKTNLIAL